MGLMSAIFGGGGGHSVTPPLPPITFTPPPAVPPVDPNSFTGAYPGSLNGGMVMGGAGSASGGAGGAPGTPAAGGQQGGGIMDMIMKLLASGAMPGA